MDRQVRFTPNDLIDLPTSISFVDLLTTTGDLTRSVNLRKPRSQRSEDFKTAKVIHLLVL